MDPTEEVGHPDPIRFQPLCSDHEVWRNEYIYHGLPWSYPRIIKHSLIRPRFLWTASFVAHFLYSLRRSLTYSIG